MASWLCFYIFNKVQNKYRAWGSSPKEGKEKEFEQIENLKGKLVATILLTGVVLILIGFFLASSEGGSCSNRFEDHCTGFE